MRVCIRSFCAGRCSSGALAVSVFLVVLAVFNGVAYHSLIAIGFFADDAAYILGAKSLLQGAYQALYLPGHPPQLDYHPGLPLLLTFFVPWVHNQWTHLLIVNAALLGAAAIFLWRLAQNWISPVSAAAIAVLFLLHDSVARLSGQLFPEPLFVCLLLSLFLLWRHLLQSPTLIGWIGLGVLTGWAALCRPEGILIIVAVAAGLLYGRRWRALICGAGIPTLIYAAWVLRNLQSPEPPDFVVFVQHIVYLFHHPMDFLRNLDLLLRMLIAGVLLGFHSWPEPLVGRLGGYLCMLAAGVAIVTGFKTLSRERKSEREIILAIVAFVALRFILFTWRTALDMRYLIVFLPFFLLAGAAGAEWFFRKRFPVALVLLVLAMGATYGYSRQREWRHLVQAHELGRTEIPSQTLSWVLSHTRSEDRFLGPAPLLQLYAGRTGYTGLYAPDAETFHTYMVSFGIRYIWTGSTDVVRTTAGPDRLDHVRILENATAWSAQNPQRYRLVYQNEKELSKIYAVQLPSKP